ncbi:hypothetical protein [Cellulomonas iranensis]|nr:hypothetical protein [Cellulomonas iranensis]
MALSRIAQMHADEIRNHDWSDAHTRLDRAGHHRADDRTPRAAQMTHDEAENVRVNVMWVTAQVLAYLDANFDVVEFAQACGVTNRHRTTGWLRAGLRGGDGHFQRPGTTLYDEDVTATTA